MTRRGNRARGARTTVALVIVVLATMVPSGIAHITSPGQFATMVPSFLPAPTILAITGALHLIVAGAVLWPRTRRAGGLAFALLCLGYLPLHLWDFVRTKPVFAPPVAASLRVLVQLLFIWVGMRLWRPEPSA